MKRTVCSMMTASAVFALGLCPFALAQSTTLPGHHGVNEMLSVYSIPKKTGVQWHHDFALQANGNSTPISGLDCWFQHPLISSVHMIDASQVYEVKRTEYPTKVEKLGSVGELETKPWITVHFKETIFVNEDGQEEEFKLKLVCDTTTAERRYTIQMFKQYANLKYPAPVRLVPPSKKS